MSKDFTIGLVVPFAKDEVPDEGLQMYPGVRFLPRGVGVRSLTPEGYDSAWRRHPAGGRVSRRAGRRCDHGDRHLAHVLSRLRLPRPTARDAAQAHRPAGQHHEPGGGRRAARFDARKIVVATAYADEVNRGSRRSWRRRASRCWALEGFGLLGFGEPGKMSEADIVGLGAKLCTAAPGAEGLLISCGGLRTLGVAKPLEDRYGVPVVSSTQAAFWAAMRLVGESGHVAGRGRLLEQSVAAPVH